MDTFIKAGDKKPTLVLLHGWGLSKETWKRILPVLSQKYTVYALDLLGFGDNQGNYTVFTLSDYIQQVHDFLKEQHIENCILLGHSFGGTVAILYTMQHPGKVKKLILYSSGLPFRNITQDFTSRTRKLIGGNAVLLFSIIQRGLRNKKITLKDFSQLYKIRGGIKPVGDTSALGKIKHPILLIAGRFDPLISLGYQKALLKKLQNAKLTIFNRSTHAAHIEEKNKFIKVVEEFI